MLTIEKQSSIKKQFSIYIRNIPEETRLQQNCLPIYQVLKS